MVPKDRLPTVLAVDDDPLILLGTAAVLGEQGWTVATATTGAAALKRVGEDASIVAVVSDLAMRGMSGIELFGAIRQLQRPVALVLVSGHAAPSEELPPGCELVVKPFAPDQLASALNAAMARLGL
jgi:CheY-like chemotaxis protein